MNAAQLVLIAWEVLVVGAVVCAVASPRRNLVGPLAFLCVLVAAVLVFPAALSVLLQNQAAHTATLISVPALNAALALRVDQLSALFLLIVSVIATLTTLYSISYMARYRDRHLVRYYPLLLLFFSGVIGVVCMADWLFFLVFWEFMTVCSYFLVVFENDKPAAARAGLKYIVMTHTASALMLVAVIALWKLGDAHSFSFAAARETMGALAATRPAVLHVLLALLFIGFGTKAGVLPFGDWLPDAYPAAPSAASAAFGGTMTKLGVYGVLRVFVEMLPVSHFSTVWGVAIAVLGAGSIFVGTLTALAQDDSKRLMSFHVIGQIGYMLLGVGAGIYLLPSHPTLAMIALMGGVFHLVNHACYKSLLFLNAGSILLRTGQTNLNRVSGLWQIMPITAITALVGSMSIAGVPPFNGFASKWLIYHVTILGAPGFPVFLLLGIVAVFVSLVTLASFLKFLGGAFLGEHAEVEGQTSAGGVPLAMQIPQVALALLCVVLGLVPMLPLAAIHRAVGGLGAFAVVPSLGDLVGTNWLGLRLDFSGGEATGLWFPVVGLVWLLGASLLAYLFSRLGAAERRAVKLWYCGGVVNGAEARYLVVEPRSDPTTEAFEARYQAHGLYGAFKEAFRSIYPSVPLPHAGYPTRFMRIFDVDGWLFGPLVRFGNRLTGGLSRTHSGVPQMYLVWQLLGLVAVVVSLAVWVR